MYLFNLKFCMLIIEDMNYTHIFLLIFNKILRCFLLWDHRTAGSIGYRICSLCSMTKYAYVTDLIRFLVLSCTR
jgi:hypothetical protein